jgi:hypothetical protein
MERADNTAFENRAEILKQKRGYKSRSRRTQCAQSVEKNPDYPVMAGLVPAIPIIIAPQCPPKRDARDIGERSDTVLRTAMRGHDGFPRVIAGLDPAVPKTKTAARKDRRHALFGALIDSLSYPKNYAPPGSSPGAEG